MMINKRQKKLLDSIPSKDLINDYLGSASFDDIDFIMQHDVHCLIYLALIGLNSLGKTGDDHV